MDVQLRAWENSYLCREEKEQVGRDPSEVALQRASASDVPSIATWYNTAFCFVFLIGKVHQVSDIIT